MQQNDPRDKTPHPTPMDKVNLQAALQRLGDVDLRQVLIWRAMTPARRAEIAFQAYQLTLEMVRTAERQRHPQLSEEELAWRVLRRMQGDQSLGR